MRAKRHLPINWILPTAFLTLICFFPQANASPSRFRVVIDPGHGGADLGTVFHAGPRILTEKNVTLSLAQEVASELRSRGYSVILTRDVDKEVPLPFRTALANRLNADLFLSIHMNSSSHNDGVTPLAAEGIETYILNNTTDASSRRLAQLENSVLGPDAPKDPGDTDVALILKDLRLDANLGESKLLACAIQNNLVETTVKKPGFTPAKFTANRFHRNRGVKQALFHVLLGADMPSVLLEAGFLSNPTDRAWVTSPAGKRFMAQSIARAIDQFKRARNTPAAWSALDRCKVN